MDNSLKTEGEMSSLNKYAMHYGLLLGAFWIFRYLFLIVAGFGISDRFKFLFYLMNIVTLLLMYIFYYKYKTSDTEKPKGIVYCILFMMMMCFYASFLEGAIMYAHFKFIDPAYFSELVSNTLKTLDTAPQMGLVTEEQYAQTKDIMVSIYSNKITYIILEFIKNIFLGLVLGIILNFVVSIKKN